MNRVVILGDGLLGSELAQQTDWDIISRKVHGFDITNTESFDMLLETYDGMMQRAKYDVVVNCIANTDTYSQDRQAHWDVNYKGVAGLVDFCNYQGVKLVQISTEFVYAHNPFPASENDLPMPANNWYAYTKLLADEFIKIRCNNYLICRELHKPSPFPYSEVWRTKTSGDTVNKIASIIINLINNNAVGTFNVGTGTKFLKDLAPKSKEVDPPLYAPIDTSMNLTKLNDFYAKHNLYS